jgi:hypothetical protein
LHDSTLKESPVGTASNHYYQPNIVHIVLHTFLSLLHLLYPILSAQWQRKETFSCPTIARAAFADFNEAALLFTQPVLEDFHTPSRLATKPIIEGEQEVSSVGIELATGS